MNKFIKVLQNFRYGSKILVNVPKHQSCRFLHNSRCLFIKKFVQTENDYAYTIMQNSGYVSKFKKNLTNIYMPKEDFDNIAKTNWSRKSPQDIFKTFSTLGPYCAKNGICITDKMFDDFIDNLTDNIKLASDDELEVLFYSLANFPPTPSVRSRNFIEIWAALDDECVKRVKDWSSDEMLLYVSLFYMINTTRNSDFVTKALNRLASRAKRLSNSQFVQTMFHVGIMRKAPFDIMNLELQLDTRFEEFSVDELGIISMGFFKSKIPIRDTNIVVKIIDRIIKEANEINEITLAALLKSIRHSINFKHDDKIYDLLETLISEIPRLSIMCNVHIALVGTATLTLHQQCLDQVAQHVINNIKVTRMKDLERIVMTYAILNYRPLNGQEFFDKVVEELKAPERCSEIDKHNRSFSCCVSYLCQLGVLSEELINKALDPITLEKYYGKNYGAYGRDILHLNNIVEIYYKDREMNRLLPKVTNVLAKRYTDYVPDANYPKVYNIVEKVMLEILSMLNTSRGGPQYVMADHILAHHQRGDVIMCDDTNGSPLPVKRFPNSKFGQIIWPPDDNKWVVLVLAGKNAYVKNTGEPTGPFFSKIRDLQQLGYYPVLVQCTKWNSFKTQGEKYSYLESLLKELKTEKSALFRINT